MTRFQKVVFLFFTIALLVRFAYNGLFYIPTEIIESRTSAGRDQQASRPSNSSFQKPNASANRSEVGEAPYSASRQSNSTFTLNESFPEATLYATLDSNLLVQHQEPSFSIVVQLSGEMGNNLGKLAHGHALSLWLRREYGVKNTTIVLRHQEHGKWVRGRKAVQKCFPNTRSFDFAAGNTPEFLERLEEQKAWLGEPYPFVGVSATDELEVEQALHNFTRLLSHNRSRPAKTPRNISLPFLYANTFASLNLFTDRYYEDFRRLLHFDPACCRLKPDLDESVFHFRNFVYEMPKVGYRLGFEELTSNRTADELFGHLKPGEKVAIATRFPDSPGLAPYLDAFKRRGVQVRVVEQQSGTEDFCFLLNAQKELVGIRKSTFFVWAAILGNCTNVRVYSVDSPAVRRRNMGRPIVHPNFTHPEIVSRIRFELYKA